MLQEVSPGCRFGLAHARVVTKRGSQRCEKPSEQESDRARERGSEGKEREGNWNGKEGTGKERTLNPKP